MMRAIASPSRCAQAANRRAKPLRWCSSSSPTRPRSSSASLSSGVMKMFPGCRSACTKPSSKIIFISVDSPRRATRFGSERVAARRQDLRPRDVAHRQDAFAGQRLDHLREHHVGVALEVLAEAPVVAGLDAEVELREHGAAELLQRSRSATASRSTGCGRSARAHSRITARSKVQISTTSGRRTLTATMRPSGRRALCTCATDADAIGTGANSA